MRVRIADRGPPFSHDYDLRRKKREENLVQRDERIKSRDAGSLSAALIHALRRFGRDYGGVFGD